MFKCCSLYSGSSGNSFLVQTDSANLLIDVGVSAKKILEALNAINCSISDISAILITHEHVDHTKSLGILSSKYNIPVYANKKTWETLSAHTAKMSSDNIKFFNTLENFYIENIKIFPFNISHDAVEPCGFNLHYENKKVTIATDIGQVTNSTLQYLQNSSCILLEANYDPNILKISSYPKMLKERIASNLGHMSNISAGKTICKIVNPTLKNILLVHLSKENNFPELAYETVSQELKGLNYIPNIVVAPRNEPSQYFEVI